MVCGIASRRGLLGGRLRRLLRSDVNLAALVEELPGLVLHALDGFFGGKATTMGPKGGDTGTAQAAAAAAGTAPSAPSAAKPSRQADTNVFKVPLEDSPRKGSDDALVVAVRYR